MPRLKTFLRSTADRDAHVLICRLLPTLLSWSAVSPLPFVSPSLGSLSELDPCYGPAGTPGETRTASTIPPRHHRTRQFGAAIFEVSKRRCTNSKRRCLTRSILRTAQTAADLFVTNLCAKPYSVPHPKSLRCRCMFGPLLHSALFAPA